MSSSEDLAALLEADTLTFLRTMGIFLVLGVALFGFTDCGKIFSLVSLSIALILTVAVTANYFAERERIARLGFAPRILVDILMYTMIFVAFFIIWIIYVVYHSEPTSLGKIAKEIEDKISQSTNAYLETMKNIEKHIDTIANNNGSKHEHISDYAPYVASAHDTHANLAKDLTIDLGRYTKQKNIANVAALAITA